MARAATRDELTGTAIAQVLGVGAAGARRPQPGQPHHQDLLPLPSSTTAGSSARTRPDSSAASTAGPAPGAGGKTRAGTGSRSPGMARMVARGTGIGRVIQRVITRSTHCSRLLS